MSRFGLVLVGAVLTLVEGAVPAAAHNVLTGNTPANGSRVGATPSSVVLTFDQPAVAMGTQVLVTGPSGQVQAGPPRLVDNTVTQDLQGGAPAGTYTVAWRVTSADGHPVSNTFTFTSTQPGAGTPPPPSNPAAPSGPARSSSTPETAILVVIGVVVTVIVGVVVAVGVVRRRRRNSTEEPDPDTAD